MKIFKPSNINFTNEPKDANPVNWKSLINQLLKPDNSKRQAYQYPIIAAILIALSLLTIYSRYNAEKLVNNVKKLEKLRKEKRAEYISSDSELTRITKQSEVVDLLKKKDLPLRPLDFPPQKIKFKHGEE